MIPSRYNRVVDCGDQNIVFNCFTGAMATVEPSQGRALREGYVGGFDSELTARMAHAGFLVSPDVDEIQVFRHTWYRAQHDMSNVNLVISPTLKCDMQCRYCLAHRSDRYMTAGTAEQVVRFASRWAARASRLTVGWFGGEPLLALDSVEYIMRKVRDFADSSGIQYRSDMFTNAYNLDEQTANLLAELGITNLVVTVDGPRAVHERRRPHVLGRPTHDRIINNVLAASRKLSIILQCVVDADNCDSAWDLYDELQASGQLGRIRFRISRVDCEATAGRVSNDHPLSAADFDRFYINALRQRIRHPNLLVPYPEMVPGCSYQWFSSWSIGPDGELYKCGKVVGTDDQSAGRVDDVPRWTSAAMAPWMNLDPCERSQCRDCSVLPLCSGGCALIWSRTGRSRCVSFKWTLDEWLKLNLELRQNRQSPVEG